MRTIVELNFRAKYACKVSTENIDKQIKQQKEELHSQKSLAFLYNAAVHLFQDQLPTRQTDLLTLQIPD